MVGCECTFSWYWLADLCLQEQIPFVLGHALYMKAIHGGKKKNDKIDSDKITMLLRGGMFPIAYVYPAGMRETRDLLRRQRRQERVSLFPLWCRRQRAGPVGRRAPDRRLSRGRRAVRATGPRTAGENDVQH